jgi:hypothetical protein
MSAVVVSDEEDACSLIQEVSFLTEIFSAVGGNGAISCPTGLELWGAIFAS